MEQGYQTEFCYKDESTKTSVQPHPPQASVLYFDVI